MLHDRFLSANIQYSPRVLAHRLCERSIVQFWPRLTARDKKGSLDAEIELALRRGSKGNERLRALATNLVSFGEGTLRRTHWTAGEIILTANMSARRCITVFGCEMRCSQGSYRSPD
jgi:hypothetical protein